MAVSASEGPMSVPRHMPCLGMNGSILAFICGSDNLIYRAIFKKPRKTGSSHIYLSILDGYNLLKCLPEWKILN